MKNLKNMLGLLVVMVFTFALVGTVSATATTFNGEIAITTEDGKVESVANWAAVASNMSDKKSVVIELTADVTLNGDDSGDLAIAADQTVTLRLNGHTLDLESKGVVVNAKGTLNVVGSGEIKSTKAAMFEVKGGNLNVTKGVTLTHTTGADGILKVSAGATSSAKSAITFASDTNATSAAGAGVVVDGSSSVAKYTTVTVAGTWETSKAVVSVSGGEKTSNAPVVNMVSGGEYTSNNANVLAINGYATVNVKGGTFTSNSNNDLVVLSAPATLNITGGNFLTEETDKYAVNVTASATTDAIAKTIQLNISAGTFKSGEDSSDEDGALLPAINIESERVLKANEGHVTGGIFYKGVANYIVSASATEGQIPAVTVSNTLTKGATTTSSNGKITVKTGSAATDPEQKPEDKPNAGDNQPDENPKTFDAIGSLIAMAVSSLGVVGTATKKVLK